MSKPILLVLAFALVFSSFVSAITGNIGNAVIIINGNVGETFERSILVNNVNEYPVNITIWTNATNIVLSESEFILDVGESKNVSFNATIESVGLDEKTIYIQFVADGEGQVGLSSLIKLNGASLASAYDIVYVTRDAKVPNGAITSIFNSGGYTWQEVKDADVPSTNFSVYGLIFIEDEINNKNLIPYKNVSSLFLNNEIAKAAWGSSFGQAAGQTRIKIYDNNSMILQNVPRDIFDQILVYTGSANVYYLNTKPAYVKNVAMAIGAQHWNDPVIANELNDTRKVRTIFFGLPETGYWTADATLMFENALELGLSGQDRDGDGFFDDDCNDGNSSINPNATEIAYNYVDENCDGKDLADVDADGFCLQGYNIMNKVLQCANEPGSIGSDCNDNNSSINLNAVEIMDGIDQNCRNDAPVLLSNIPNKIFDEDESLINTYNLLSYFADYEGNSLTFSYTDVSDISVVINNENVSLYPAANFNGNRYVRFIASDGINSTYSNNITLSVMPVNDAPVLQAFNDIYVVEGGIVNVSADASDVDSSSLAYNINDTRFFHAMQNSSIFSWQTSTGSVGNYVFNVSVSDGSLSDSEDVKIYVLGKLYINEFESKPVSGEDWVEVYNPGNSSYDLTNCILKDLAGNTKTLSGNLPVYGFSAFDWSNRLNNDGDTIYLLCGNMTIDEITYGSGNLTVPGDGQSLGRTTDGGSSWALFNWPTKAMSNLVDAEPPQVMLISPLNNSFYNSRFVNENLTFNFTASDNKASYLNCTFYSDVNSSLGIFEPLASGYINNGSAGSFWAADIADGSYIWNIRCSDGVNYAFASSNWTFSIDAPDAPVLQSISDLIVNETDLAGINAFASDADNDTLTYSINDSRFTQNSSSFSWQTGYDDSGIYYVNVSVSDGTGLSDSQEVRVDVLNKNRNPIFNGTIPDISFNEDESLILDLIGYFYDEDNDSLSYGISGNTNVNAVFNNSVADLSAAGNWSGSENISFYANDGFGITNSNNVTINVLPVNDAPVLQSFADINVLEGSLVVISAAANDVDNDSLVYSINDSRFTQNSSSFSWQTSYGDAGQYVFNVLVSDGSLSDNEDVRVNVVDNQMPVIDSYFPGYNPKLADNEVQIFNISWHDVDSAASVKWFINGNLSSSSDSLVFSLPNAGDYEISAVVSDSEFNVSHDWQARVSNVPLTDSYAMNDFSGTSEEGLANFLGFFIQNSFGKIEFLESVDLRNIVDIDRYVRILQSLAALDIAKFTSLSGKKARVSLYNIANDTDVYYSSSFTENYSEIASLCSSGVCSNINYSGNVLSFDVSSFSSFKAGNLASCSEKGGVICGNNSYCSGSIVESIDSGSCCIGSCIENPPSFSDIETCENKSSLLSVEISKPESGDDFKIGETIKIKAKVKNNGEEDESFDVLASLYDLTDDEEIKSEEENADIDEGDDEYVNFEIEVPKDIDESHEFAIYIKAEDDICNDEYVKIDLKRDKHSVIIDELDFPDSVSCSETLKVNLKVENIGTKDEDVTLRLDILDLDYSSSQDFSLEKYEDDNKIEKAFYVEIPENASEKSYMLKASVSFEDDENVYEEEFSVASCKRVSQETISAPEVQYLGSVRQGMKTNEDMVIIVSFLAAAILIVLTLISVVWYYRKH